MPYRWNFVLFNIHGVVRGTITYSNSVCGHGTIDGTQGAPGKDGCGTPTVACADYERYVPPQSYTGVTDSGVRLFAVDNSLLAGVPEICKAYFKAPANAHVCPLTSLSWFPARQTPSHPRWLSSPPQPATTVRREMCASPMVQVYDSPQSGCRCLASAL